MRARHSAVDSSMHARLSDHQLRKLQRRRLCQLLIVHAHARFEGGNTRHDAGLARTLLLRSSVFKTLARSFTNLVEFACNCAISEAYLRHLHLHVSTREEADLSQKPHCIRGK